MTKLTQISLRFLSLLAAFNVSAAEYSSKDYCLYSSSIAASFVAAKADGKEVNFDDFRHNMTYYSDKLTSPNLKTHAEKFSDAMVSVAEEQGRAVLSKMYDEFDRDYQKLAQYIFGLCKNSFSQLSVDNSSLSQGTKELDEIQQTSEQLVRSMNSYPGCEEYKKIILSNAYSDAPTYVRQRRLEVHYQKVTQLRCL